MEILVQVDGIKPHSGRNVAAFPAPDSDTMASVVLHKEDSA
jgi:hypothetical protein